MRHLFEFLSFDIRVHSRYLGLAVAAIVGLGIVSLSRPPETRSFFLAGTLIALAPTVIAFWLIGNDRSKGTMTLLATLPITRTELVAIKALETFLLSVVLGLIDAVVAVVTGATVSEVLQLLMLCVPLSLGAASLAAMAFFVLPSRVALYALLGIFFLIGHESGSVVAALSGTSPIVRDAIAAAGSLAVFLVVVATTAVVWGSRSPSETF